METRTSIYTRSVTARKPSASTLVSEQPKRYTYFMIKPTNEAMTSDERYLSIAQEVYLHAVKTYYSFYSLLEVNSTLLRTQFDKMAALADDAAAAFNDRFEPLPD